MSDIEGSVAEEYAHKLKALSHDELVEVVKKDILYVQKLSRQIKGLKKALEFYVDFQFSGRPIDGVWDSKLGSFVEPPVLWDRNPAKEALKELEK